MIVTLLSMCFGAILGLQWTRVRRASHRTASTQTEEIVQAVHAIQTGETTMGSDNVIVSPHGKCWHKDPWCWGLSRANSQKSIYPCPICA